MASMALSCKKEAFDQCFAYLKGCKGRNPMDFQPEDLEEDKDNFCGLMHGRDLVGYVTLNVKGHDLLKGEKEREQPEDLEITRMEILPRFRKKGLARALEEMVRQHAKGFKRVIVSPSFDRKGRDMTPFWEKLGYLRTRSPCYLEKVLR